MKNKSSNQERYAQLHKDKTYVKGAIECLEEQLRFATKDSVIKKLTQRIEAHKQRLI